ncbi:helix-turn-helix domain-containing protein [Virgibacillus dokdonensis]|uniref:HTH-type transcriptional regulator SinR n=1 Tax=Virgibacillus dokdonensis TaxID=302167 RepID=A0A2K9IV11_9BACI|nr:HTH-type transcriptional regulator SinR [Virgibacillus dokdonensis]
MSISALAEKTGVAKSYLSSIERGLQKNPSIQFIEKLIYVLGVSINELLQEETSLAAEQYDEEWLEIVKETMESGMIKEHLKNT